MGTGTTQISFKEELKSKLFEFYFLGFVTAKVQEGISRADAFRAFNESTGLDKYDFSQKQAEQKWRYLTQKRMTGEISL